MNHNRSFAWRWLLVCVLLAALLPLMRAAAQDLPPAVYLPMLVRGFVGSTNPIHTGEGTYYHATGAGSCGFAASPGDLMVAAMNGSDYGNADYCGAYIHAVGPKGEVTVRIVDLCPGCAAGDVDFSREAFEKIANLAAGRVPVQWQVVSPNISGPIAYHIKDGSNPWWLAVQIRNHRNPIASLEYWNGSAWIELPRQSYNYFVRSSGMQNGPFTFRVTDWYGNQLVDSGIPLAENTTIDGAAQFPFWP